MFDGDGADNSLESALSRALQPGAGRHEARTDACKSCWGCAKHRHLHARSRDLRGRAEGALLAGKPVTITPELGDGRIISIENHPMAGGGWVSTHEDITERRHAEQQLREQKHQLDTALNNMSQGLNMFDAPGRLVVCNERYLQMYGLSPDDREAGMHGRRAGRGPHRQRHILRRRSGALHRRAPGGDAQARGRPARRWSCRTAASSPSSASRRPTATAGSSPTRTSPSAAAPRWSATAARPSPTS